MGSEGSPADEDGAPEGPTSEEFEVSRHTRGDWVPCAGYGTQSSIVGVGALNILLVAPRDALNTPPTTEIATVEESTDVVVDRTVGQVDISSTGATVFIERIRVGIFDNSGANAFFANSFADPDDANERFLWQRVSRFGAADFNILAPLGLPWWSVVDTNVSRMIASGVALFYSVQQLTAVVTLRVTPYLRSYARSRG